MIGQDLIAEIGRAQLPLLVMAGPGGGSRFLTGQLGRMGKATNHRDRSGSPEVLVTWRPQDLDYYRTVWGLVRDPLRATFSVAGLLTPVAGMDAPYSTALHLVDGLMRRTVREASEIFRLEDIDTAGARSEERTSHALTSPSWVAAAGILSAPEILRLQDLCSLLGYPIGD